MWGELYPRQGQFSQDSPSRREFSPSESKVCPSTLLSDVQDPPQFSARPRRRQPSIWCKAKGPTSATRGVYQFSVGKDSPLRFPSFFGPSRRLCDCVYTLHIQWQDRGAEDLAFGDGDVTGLFDMGSGMMIVANKAKMLKGTVTTRLTRRNTGIVLLKHGARINGGVMRSVHARKNRALFLAASMLSQGVLRRGLTSVLGTCKQVSTLLGTTKNGVPKTAVSPANSVFSLGVSRFRGMLSLGLANAVLPARMFLGPVIRRETNTVIGFSSVTTFHPLAHITNCTTTGTKVSGFATFVTARVTGGFNRKVHVGTVTPKFFLARRGHTLLAGPSNACARQKRSMVHRAPFKHVKHTRRLYKAVRCLVDSTTDFMANAITMISKKFGTFTVWEGSGF